MLENEIYDAFLLSGAVQEGHFLLSSGLHSDKYVQCAQISKNTLTFSKIIKILVGKILHQIKRSRIDMIISPAIGGIVPGYEVARQIGCKYIFCERVNGKFALRRSFNIEPGTSVLVIEDVVTTAKSFLEVVSLLERFHANVVGLGALIDRSTDNIQGLPENFISLLKIKASLYEKGNLPSHLAEQPIDTPGSRFIK